MCKKKLQDFKLISVGVNLPRHLIFLLKARIHTLYEDIYIQVQ